MTTSIDFAVARAASPFITWLMRHPTRIGQVLLDLRISAIMYKQHQVRLARVMRFLRGRRHGMVYLSGPMRSGKSRVATDAALLLRRTHRPVLCIKPMLDNRAGQEAAIKSRSRPPIPAHNMSTPEDLQRILKEQAGNHVVIIDEAHFLQEDVAKKLIALAKSRVLVVAGLDLDFAGERFPGTEHIRIHGRSHLGQGHMLHLHFTGVCQVCGDSRATHSKLIAQAPKDGGRFLVGDSAYLTVCRTCHGA